MLTNNNNTRGALPADLERAAALIDQLRGDLSTRLDSLHKAPAYRKLEESRFVLAAFFEILHAQSSFNAAALAAIGELTRAATRPSSCAEFAPKGAPDA